MSEQLRKKCLRVLLSCETQEQATVAKAYVRLAVKQMGLTMDRFIFAANAQSLAAIRLAHLPSRFSNNSQPAPDPTAPRDSVLGPEVLL